MYPNKVLYQCTYGALIQIRSFQQISVHPSCCRVCLSSSTIRVPKLFAFHPCFIPQTIWTWTSGNCKRADAKLPHGRKLHSVLLASVEFMMSQEINVRKSADVHHYTLCLRYSSVCGNLPFPRMVFVSFVWGWFVSCPGKLCAAGEDCFTLV